MSKSVSSDNSTLLLNISLFNIFTEILSQEVHNKRGCHPLPPRHREYQLIMVRHREYQLIMVRHREYQLIMVRHREYQLILNWNPEY